MGSDSLSTIAGIIYFIIGLIVASGHAYFTNLNRTMPILSAILAVLAWPLVLFGLDLHFE
jgi:Mn2+/Fe2+ NRAMP family transporter